MYKFIGVSCINVYVVYNVKCKAALAARQAAAPISVYNFSRVINNTIKQLTQ